ncbi:MATE family efflux transporter [Acetanaerobacterium elongatum]|uniref:Probable multidrug resistance protein NorM n=1 Tax=Acetanaerobacterium elongatum TaxID=258515 RepID=A0A1H0FYM2_9FIRM|nr:MATE family efflux transporter [Acetanaerobacterium elongatum]SDN99682.1 putative efflux protein, MATE family [Acetanaerobacterium elongatum]
MPLLKDRAFYKNIIAIALPIALQNLIGFGVNMTDTIMIGSLGQTQLSAVSLANQVFFIFNILTFGISSGACVLTAQYWGKGDTAAIRRVFAIALDIAVLFSLLFSAAAFFFPHEIMCLFSTEASIIAEGVKYLRIMAFAYFFFGITNTYLTVLRSIENVHISLIVFGSSFVVNVIVNYLLIFGKLGFPKMGVVGAAIGTLTARIVEFIMIIVYIVFVEKKIRFSFTDMLKPDRLLFRDYISYGIPVLFNELLWSVGSSMQSVIIGRIGSDFVAANSITGVFMQLTTIIIFGVASAAAVVVGKAVGSGQNDYVRKCADTLMLLSVGIGIFGAAMLLSLRGIAVSFYNVPDATKSLAQTLMIIAAINVFFVSVNAINLIGTLRGAGDTKFVFAADTIMIWVLAAPLGILTGWVLKLPFWIVYFCLKIDEPIKAIASIARIKGSKWVKNVTR